MYNTIKLEKGLYNITSKSFTQALCDLDPDDNYKGTELESLDAFERQLKRFDIKLCGESSDKVEKFFRTTESAVLFPEFVRRAIRQGMDEASIIGNIASATTCTSATDYRGIVINSPVITDEAITEGSEIPATSVALASTTTPLVKVGRKISTSYEAVRQQRLDLFAVVLRTVGAQLSKVINKYAVDKLYETGANLTTDTTSLTYADLVNFFANFENYNLTTMVVNPSLLATIMQLPEMESYKAEYVKSGVIKAPFGADIIKCNSVPDGTVIGLDNSCALEFILGSDVIVDFEKLISTQMQDTAFTITIGFSAIVPDAVKVLTKKTA